MANQISDILDKPASEVDRPKPLPTGTYEWMIQGMPRHDKSREKQTPFVEFTLKCMDSYDDVDQEALEQWAQKADGSQRALTDFTTRLTFYLVAGVEWRLQDFLKHCGLNLEGKTIRQALDETPNCQVVGHVVHRASQDGASVFANIDKTAPVE